MKALYFFYFSAFGIFATYLNLYYRSIGLSGIQIGWLSAVVPAVAIVSGPLWGLLNDRVGRPRMQLAVAAAGSILVMLAIPVPSALIALLPLAGLYSLFNSTIMPIIDTTTINILGSRRDRYGRQRIWGTVGFILTTWVTGQLTGQLGLRTIFPIYAVVMLGLLAALRFLPRQRLHLSLRPQGGLVRMVTQPKWLFFSLSLFFLGLSISGMNNFLGISLKMAGGSDRLVGSVWSLAALAEIPVLYFSAYLIRNLGLRRMLVVAFLVYAVRFALYAVMPSPEWALPLSLMHGFTFGLYWVASVMFINRMAPDHLKTTSQGLFLAITYLANVLGAPFGGAMLDRIGPSALFAVYSGFAFIGLIVLLAGFRFAREPSPGEAVAE